LNSFLLALATTAKATVTHVTTAAGKTVPATTPPALPTTTVSAPVTTVMQLSWMQQHAAWFTHTVAAIGVIAAVGLIVLLAVQTTKQEGLSGTIGGKVESAYRGRPGVEDQLKRITGFTAGTFVVAFLILSLTGI